MLIFFFWESSGVFFEKIFNSLKSGRDLAIEPVLIRLITKNQKKSVDSFTQKS
jgi:hypothetical protein